MNGIKDSAGFSNADPVPASKSSPVLPVGKAISTGLGLAGAVRCGLLPATMGERTNTTTAMAMAIQPSTPYVDGRECPLSPLPTTWYTWVCGRLTAER